VAQENQISIAINDLPNILEQSSPDLKILYSKKKLAKTEYDLSMQWINPELNYEHEEVKMGDAVISEDMIFLSKSFDLPWNYWKESQIREADTLVAGLEYEEDRNHLLSDMRRGYVQLALLKDLKNQLINISKMLDKLVIAVEAREMEGAISHLESSLISMGLFGLESDILETQMRYKMAMSQWKQSLGISPHQIITLIDSIEFNEISLDSIQNQQFLDYHPGFLAHTARLDARDSHISLVKSRIFPSISLSGGYKKINEGWEGYILGLSLPLPLLNWNKPQVETRRINHQNQLTRTNTYKHKLQYKLEDLVSNVILKSNLLQKNKNQFENQNIIYDMLGAYEEGQLSLPDFLNAIQLYRSSSKQYFENLYSYYSSVFELEALSGQQLVSF